MRVLVLGGSAFVGLELVRLLAARGHDVTVLNRGVTATTLPDGVKRLIADRTDTESIRNALGQRTWDAVFDISGFVMVAGKSDVDSLFDLLTGQVGHYLFCSSITVYEPSGIFPWTEDFKLVPPSTESYGAFKSYVEHKLFARFREQGFPATTVRPAAIYGPHNNFYDMEAPMFLRLLRGLPVLVPHAGLVTCSYGHVDDLCRFMVDIAGNEAAKGEAFNLTAEAVTVNYYVQALAETVGKPADLIYLPHDRLASLPAPVFGHLFGTAHHSMLSIEKAKRFEFQPQYDFKTGHHQTFEWFMAQGFAETEEVLRDPLWRSSYDFKLERQIADSLRASAGAR